MIHRLHRIQILNNIHHDLKDIVVFPRNQRQQQSGEPRFSKVAEFVTNSDTMTDQRIENIVETARQEAITICQKVGITVKDESWNKIYIPKIAENDDFNSDPIENIHGEITPFEENDVISQKMFESMPIDIPEMSEKLLQNLESDISSLGIGEELMLKDFTSQLQGNEEENVDINGPLVKVTFGNKSALIKKSSFVWLLEESKDKVSVDRLRRFVSNAKTDVRNAVDKSLDTTTKKQTSQKRARGKKTSSAESSAAKMTKKRKINKKNSKKNEDPDGDSTATGSTSEDDILVTYNDSTDTETFSDVSTVDETGDEAKHFAPRDSSIFQNSQEPQAQFSGSLNQVDADSNPMNLGNSLQQPIDSNRKIIEKCFYAVYYEQKWYVGYVDEILNNGSCSINFLKQMAENQLSFKWPATVDKDDVEYDYIFHGPIDFEILSSKKSEKKCHEKSYFKLTKEEFQIINITYLELKNKFR